jgi:hypothetical protein
MVDRLTGRPNLPRRKTNVLDVLFPKVRAGVLRLLFSKPKIERYVRELARLSSVSLSTMQQELAGLTACCLLASRSNGYHRFYKANRDHPLFYELHLLVVKSLKKKTFRARKSK